jgi:hypothetical protein
VLPQQHPVPEMPDEKWKKACWILGFICDKNSFLRKEVNSFLFGLQLSLLLLQLRYNTTTRFTADNKLGRKITEESKVSKISIAL